MARECIEQATCVECGESDDNYTLRNREMKREKNALAYYVRCSCAETATIILTEGGIVSSDSVSYDDATWNSNEDDDSDEDHNA